MEKVRIEEIDPRMGPATAKRPLTEALGTTDVAINHYELAPGETFGFGYHRHPAQEEVFHVIEGVATFETEDGDVEVAAGECVRFAPGEWQLGRNDGDERVLATAVGAPLASRETETLRACEDCGGRTRHRVETVDGRDALVTVCEDCGAETGRYT